jgi:hypothetical protein
MDRHVLISILVILGVLYLVHSALHRLFYTPISHVPGPRLAALTFWYEFYYDVIKDGRYSWKIKELHEQYGRLLTPPIPIQKR